LFKVGAGEKMGKKTGVNEGAARRVEGSLVTVMGKVKE